MKIAFDGQLLFEKQKTGIGYTADYIIKNIIKEYKNEYFINCFSLYKNKNSIMIEYETMGYKINKCRWFHNVIYKRIWNSISIPYSLFFKDIMDITQFFNYDVPPGVKGKTVTFIYDMVYKAHPETVSKETYKMLDYNVAKSCDRADHIVTISEFSKKEIIKYMNVSPSKISVMPCGVDLTVYHNKYTINEINEVKNRYSIVGDYVLYLGTLEPRKNILRLIEAYAKLKEECNIYPKLVIAGKKGWMYDEIFEKVKKLKVEVDIIFTGYVNKEDVPILFKGAKIFVFPSLYEGFGLPPLESMACGTPVIVSNKASMPEVVQDAGILIDPYSVNEIKEAMIILLKDSIVRNKYIIKGYERSKRYTWKASINKLIQIYKDIR